MSNASYIQAQFNKLQLTDNHISAIKILGGLEGSTHWLNITNKQVEQIKQILLQGASDETVL